MSKVRIEMTGPMRGKVWVDGVEQDQLTGIHIEADIIKDVPCRVTLTRTIYCPDLELVGEQVDVTTLTNNGARVFAPGTRVGELCVDVKADVSVSDPYWKPIQ